MIYSFDRLALDRFDKIKLFCSRLFCKKVWRYMILFTFNVNIKSWVNKRQLKALYCKVYQQETPSAAWDVTFHWLYRFCIPLSLSAVYSLSLTRYLALWCVHVQEHQLTWQTLRRSSLGGRGSHFFSTWPSLALGNLAVGSKLFGLVIVSQSELREMDRKKK